MKSLIASLIFLLPLQDKRKPGNPLEHLPKNIEVLTHFGERADFSPDNQGIAFMSKSFGDAMVIDLKTRIIRCLTCNIPAAAFLRVMHLSTGDYILIGPDHFENIRISRSRDNELWFLSKQPGSKPVKLEQKMNEGAAISKKNLLIAFAETHGQSPELPDGASRLVIADVDLSGATPKLVNKRTVYESKDRNCVLEAQDFYDNDTKLTFECYEPGGLASVWGIDLKTKQVTNFSQAPGEYNETEGIFPGGQYTCVESDHQCSWLGGTRGAGNIDIWKLKMDGTGKSFTRLTNFNDYEGGKSSNPVISTDGKFMAFQSAKTTDPAGVGYGLLLYHFDSAPSTYNNRRMLLRDEALSTLSYVDIANPANNWYMPVPAGRDLQLVGNGRVLIGTGTGYEEREIATGKKVKEVTSFAGTISARKLKNGNILLAGINWQGKKGIALAEINESGAVQRLISYPQFSYVRLIRETSKGTFLVAANDTVFEGDASGAVSWKVKIESAVQPHAWQALRLKDGRTVVSGGYSGNMQIFSADGKPVKTISGPPEVKPTFYSGFQIMPNGHYVVTNWQGHGPGHGAQGIQLLEYDENGALAWSWKQDPEKYSSIQGVIVLDGLDTNLTYIENEQGVLAPVK